jgi:hypothetical protein
MYWIIGLGVIWLVAIAAMAYGGYKATQSKPVTRKTVEQAKAKYREQVEVGFRNGSGAMESKWIDAETYEQLLAASKDPQNSQTVNEILRTL